MTAPLLLATDVTKTFGTSRALDGAQVSIGRGAIHGLLGKNGAGKSTLARTVAGLVRPEQGRIVLDGQDLSHASPAQRRRLGIRLLDQHSEVLPDLSVTENLLLGGLPRRRGLVDWRAAHEGAAELLAEHNLPLDPRGAAGRLTLSQRRRLAIVKALAGEGRLVILDEPTTGLTIAERRDLMHWVRRLADAGRTFVYISHHNDEVRQLCTEYTVLRDGRTVAHGTNAAGLSAAELSAAVTGTAVREFHRARRRGGADLLGVRGLEAAGVGPVDLTVREGEIVALVGLPGLGPQELLRALAGLSGAVRGEVRVAGRPVSCRHPRASSEAGLAYLTHDRIAEGVAAHLSVADNLHLGRWPRGRGRLVDSGRMAERSEQVRRDLAVAQAGPWQEAGRLSGGNQQKVLLGRLLTRRPRVLLLDEPTLGIDVAAKEAIHRLIDTVTGEGMAVLLRAYDPDETARLADRAVLFTGGRITGELTGDDLTVSAIATAQHVGGRP
ncbi:sugar ABC transporter ATP-binding protein [Streptomyces odontomachi]|uniref:sugar ABC transporter ATP-binding protein n=1 Tax=Streptomyces odontomachi TaxID=2944940 RepID=UPI00210D9482|nr:sugar ABC transporter ATP-binding protein [Streptomyces sp. ODS25]